MTNEERYKRSKLRKILRIINIFLSLATIILAILSLTIKLSVIFPCITLILTGITTKYRESLAYKEKK